MRIVCGLLFLLLLGTFAPVRPTPPASPPSASLVTFEPLSLGEDPVAGAGRLRPLGAWNLESNDWRFGGLSAMHVEGGFMLAVSDSGWIIRFPLAASGTRRATIAALPGRLGATRRKPDRDVESLAAHGRYVWFGMERKNAVWRLAGPDLHEEGGMRPAAIRKWASNRGAESLARLPDGRFLAISEGVSRGLSEAVLFLGDPATPGTRAVRMRYRPPAGYRPTDAAMLPDGRLLILHRRTRLFEGITAKLAVAALPGDTEGAVIEPAEIATLSPPRPVDNMEALSVTVESGRTIVWIASDDNYMPLQRTLLLKFALDR